MRQLSLKPPLRSLDWPYSSPADGHLIGEAPIGCPVFPILVRIALGTQPDDAEVFGDDYHTPYPSVFCPRSTALGPPPSLLLAEGHRLVLDGLAPECKIFDDCPTEARYKAYLQPRCAWRPSDAGGTSLSYLRWL